MEATSDPCPISVIAKAPGTVKSMMPGRNFLWWGSVPRCSTAEPNRPHCTPDLICSEGLADTSSSNAAILPPLSSSPPSDFGKARCTCPFSCRMCSWAKVRLRCSSRLRPRTSCSAGFFANSREVRRTSAQVPRSCLPRLSTSTDASGELSANWASTWASTSFDRRVSLARVRGVTSTMKAPSLPDATLGTGAREGKSPVAELQTTRRGARAGCGYPQSPRFSLCAQIPLALGDAPRHHRPLRCAHFRRGQLPRRDGGQAHQRGASDRDRGGIRARAARGVHLSGRGNVVGIRGATRCALGCDGGHRDRAVVCLPRDRAHEHPVADDGRGLG